MPQNNHSKTAVALGRAAKACGLTDLEVQYADMVIGDPEEGWLEGARRRALLAEMDLETRIRSGRGD